MQHPDSSFLSGLLVLLVLPAALSAQSWSNEQLDVWEDVERMNELFVSGDIEGAYEYVHPDIVWWNTGNDVPGGYEEARRHDTAWGQHKRTNLSNACKPLSIQVFDDISIVNAYCRGYIETAEGKDLDWSTNRFHFVMKKEGDRWLQVANFLDFN